MPPSLPSSLPPFLSFSPKKSINKNSQVCAYVWFLHACACQERKEKEERDREMTEEESGWETEIETQGEGEGLIDFVKQL